MERSREVDNALNSSMAEYCLRWNNHQPNLVSVFSELLSAETLTDVTLAVDGKYIYAHKLVLSACSDYFKELFAGTPCKHPIVIFKDVKIEDLKTVVDFVYRGEVNISQDRLQDVMKTGEMLKIKGLSEKPKSREDSSSHPQGGLSCGSQFSARGRSSLTDPREHSSSLEDEKSESAPVAHMPKKRRLTPHTSSESTHDREEEAEPRSRGSSDIKEEESEEVEVELELQEEDPAIKSESGLHLSGNAGAEDVGEPSEVGSLRQSDISCSSQGSSEWPLPLTSAWWTLPVLAAQHQHLRMPSVHSIIPQATSSFIPQDLRASDLSGRMSPSWGRGSTSREGSPASNGNTTLIGDLDRPAVVAVLGKEVSPQMVRALQAVASKRESFSSAAKLYSVSVTTLWRYFRKLGLSDPVRPHQS